MPLLLRAKNLRNNLAIRFAIPLWRADCSHLLHMCRTTYSLVQRLSASAWIVCSGLGLLLIAPCDLARCQDAAPAQLSGEEAEPKSTLGAKQVDVQPKARDSEIAARLTGILEATEWIANPEVRLDEGVVFLSGTADSEEHRKWAGELARNTQDVAAVVNKMHVAEPIWDLGPVLEGLQTLGRDIVLWMPLALLALLILAAAGVVSLITTRSSRMALRRRIQSPLLRDVAARLIGGLVLVLALYLVLRVCGLSRLALTVLGGTGLIGLVIGIAFRDITENFLASISLSVQRPFRIGDLVEIVGILGYVQSLTIRTTVLMTLDGNHVQIPNATVYKNTIRNFSTNPNRRDDFTIGIGYSVSIAEAQEVALAAIQSHPAVLHDPEPWVLADNLGPATVNLRIYFWVNGNEHSWVKVRSSIIRLVKRSFQEHGIEMPDEARELVFPNGVPVRMVEDQPKQGTTPAKGRAIFEATSSAEPVTTQAEAGLEAEAKQIGDQARNSPQTEAGENLLPGSPLRS